MRKYKKNLGYVKKNFSRKCVEMDEMDEMDEVDEVDEMDEVHGSVIRLVASRLRLVGDQSCDQSMRPVSNGGICSKE